MSYHAITKHHTHLKYLDHKEIDALYWSVFVKGIGDSLISVFTAIYLLSLGFSLNTVAIFYIIYFAVLALLARSSMKLSHSWGVKKTLGLGIAFLILNYGLLGFIKAGLPYQYVALVYGVGASLYWTAFQLDLARALRMRSSGRALSNIKIFSILASIAGPIAGALFIVNLSFVYLFLTVIFILACSMIPLFRWGDYKIESNLSDRKTALKIGGPKKAVMYLLFGITESAVDILWPVYLYLNYPNLLSVGGIISGTAVLMLFAMYVFGKFADRNSSQAYRVGVLSHAPTWVLRLLWLTPGGLFFSNFLGTATNSLVAITVDQAMYRDAKDAETSSPSLLFRFYYAAIGRIIILIVAVLLNSTSTLFVIVAVFTLLQLAYPPKMHPR